MMKFLKHSLGVLFLFAGIFTATVSVAQCDLKRYQELIKEGDLHLTRAEPDYKQALNAYSAAMTACKDKMPEVQKKIVGLFDRINQLKTKAELSEKAAQAARVKADSALVVAENEKAKAEAEKQIAIYARFRTDSALNIANRIVDRMFFYNNKFALAVKNEPGGPNVYGFIDKQGETVIGFNFTEALPFNPETGFAKVEMWDRGKFLLDTTGRTYELCDDTNNLVYKYKGEVYWRFSGQAVDFSGKRLTTFPDEIINATPDDKFDAPQINILILSNNQLQELSENISVFADSLTFLSLRNNQISKLPYQIGKLKSLIKLDVSSNKLTELPVEIGNLMNLEQLDLHNNRLLQTLPVELGKLRNLKSLNLNTSGVKMLPPEIGNCNSLEEITLAFDSLDGFDESGYNEGIKLSFRRNRNPDFCVLPTEIGNLKNLKKLNVSTSGLHDLPKETGNLVNLKTLILRCNLLDNIPAEIGRLKKLEILDLHQNNIAELPSEIVGLSNLSTLLLDFNNLTVLPSGITGLMNLRFLDLEGNRLSVIPAEIGTLKKLSRINLAGNRLTSLPYGLGELKNLTSLNLARNALDTLPERIGDLENLESLILQKNNLTSLPKNIGKLVNLTWLNLNSNKLQSLPDEIWNLVKLESLMLQCNQLTSLSPFIGQLTNLEELNVSHNRLTSLPKEIGQLTKLKWLNLDSNNLISLPSEIGNLKNLKKLDLRYNDISETEKLKITELLPDTKIVWSDNDPMGLSVDNTLKPYLNAVKKYKVLTEQYPGQYSEPLAEALSKLANAQKLKYHTDDVKSAESNYSEALSLYRELAKMNADLYTPMVAATLDSLADVQLWYGSPSADSTCLEALALSRSLAKINPIMYSANVGYCLRSLSRAQFKTNPKSAVKNIREAIEIYEGLVKSDSSLNSQLAKCYANLAYYITFDRNFKEAEKLARLALKTDPSFNAVNRYLAPILLFQGKYKEAKSIYLEYKDQEFPKYRYVKYKDGFLVDFERFEKAGITHPDVGKIRELLKD